MRDSPLAAGGESRNLGKRLKPISVLLLSLFSCFKLAFFSGGLAFGNAKREEDTCRTFEIRYLGRLLGEPFSKGGEEDIMIAKENRTIKVRIWPKKFTLGCGILHTSRIWLNIGPTFLGNIG